MSLARLEVIAIGGALVVGAVVLWRAKSVASGILSGDNVLTRTATNADGEPVTAYQGVPVFGTLGAAANAASGGYLASFGQWLGGTVYEATHPDPNAPPRVPSSADGIGYDTNGDYNPWNSGIYGWGA